LLVFGDDMRDDIVARLLGGDADLETSRYLDRLLELASLEEAEYQFLLDPFDRSVALVFQLFNSSDLDPWDVDLSSFLDMFNERIENTENIDLPTCGKLVRMAWTILRSQAATLIERQENSLNCQEEEIWDFEGGWESDLDDEDYIFTGGVLSGAADEALPSIFEGRIHRGQGRPVTLGELLIGLQSAGKLAEEQRMRETIAKERREANEKARARFSGSLHVENLEDDLRRTWYALKNNTNENSHSVELKDIVTSLNDKSLKSGLNDEEAKAEAQVTALVSALFLTNRGSVDLNQQEGRGGKIILRNLWEDAEDFNDLTEHLFPKSEIRGVKSV
jgi:chromatin segregation and condensation protein Rec8/ScpA/Scc1 (kleisin family)